MRRIVRWLRSLVRRLPQKRGHQLYTAKPLEPGRYPIALARVDKRAHYWKVVDPKEDT